MKQIISRVLKADDTATHDVSVGDVLNAVRTGGENLKPKVEKIRTVFQAELARSGDPQKAKLAVDPLKKRLPAVTFSGRFSRRDVRSLLTHSGLLCADLDSLGTRLPEVREKLESSPHVVAVFRSPTADGLKALFRVPDDGARHLASYRAVEKHVLELTGVRIDESCKDVARLCFMSYDPEIWESASARDIEPLPEPEKTRVINNGNVKLSERQKIATDLLGVIDWQSETSGLVVCPGKHLHQTGDGERDCKFDCDGVPTVHCFHDHCSGILAAINKELRSRIGRVEFQSKSDTGPIVGFRPLDKAGHKSPPEKETETDEATLQRLAALPPLEYDRVRVGEAQRLGCRPATLDKYVESQRLTLNTGLQGRAMQLPDVELWPEPVNGAEVLNEASRTIADYVVLPPSAADVCAVWCAHAHVFRAFPCSPRLHVSSPEMRCGKTTLRDVIALHTPRWLLAENLSVAVLFRVIEKFQPTFLADECDAWLRDNEELRGMLNAGHRRGGQALRCEGESNDVRAFNVFAPVVLCGIGALPGTLHDRSIRVRLERAKPGEISKRFDPNRLEPEKECCRKVARFCADNFSEIEACDPKLPAGVFNRLADNWRPLFAIAEVARGDWPQRMATALFELTDDDDVTAQGIGTRLLADIREIFANEGADRLHSETIATHLAGFEGKPWAEWGRAGKPISKNQVAKQLKHFNIEPRDVRIGDTVLKGYLLEHFEEAFARYLPADPPFRNATALQKDDFTYENTGS